MLLINEDYVSFAALWLGKMTKAVFKKKQMINYYLVKTGFEIKKTKNCFG